MVTYCFENGCKLSDPEMVKQAYSSAVTSGNPQMIDELEKRGHLSINDWDLDETMNFLCTAYDRGGARMFEKVVQLKPSTEALIGAIVVHFQTFIRKNDLETLKLLEKKGVLTTIIKNHEEFEIDLLPDELEGSDAAIYILKQLNESDIKKCLEKNLTVIKNDQKMMKFASDHGVDVKD